MLTSMPALTVPNTAAAAANGGAQVQYDPARAVDTWPGAPMRTAPAVNPTPDDNQPHC